MEQTYRVNEFYSIPDFLLIAEELKNNPSRKDIIVWCYKYRYDLAIIIKRVPTKCYINRELQHYALKNFDNDNVLEMIPLPNKPQLFNDNYFSFDEQSAIDHYNKLVLQQYNQVERMLTAYINTKKTIENDFYQSDIVIERMTEENNNGM